MDGTLQVARVIHWYTTMIKLYHRGVGIQTSIVFTFRAMAAIATEGTEFSVCPVPQFGFTRTTSRDRGHPNTFVARTGFLV